MKVPIRTAYRVITELAEAGIIDLDTQSLVLTPKPEAMIMTRHLIRYTTMKALMSMDDVGDEELVLKVCTTQTEH
jgi:hypothetical protein